MTEQERQQLLKDKSLISYPLALIHQADGRVVKVRVGLYSGSYKLYNCTTFLSALKQKGETTAETNIVTESLLSLFKREVNAEEEAIYPSNLTLKSPFFVHFTSDLELKAVVDLDVLEWNDVYWYKRTPRSAKIPILCWHDINHIDSKGNYYTQKSIVIGDFVRLDEAADRGIYIIPMENQQGNRYYTILDKDGKVQYNRVSLLNFNRIASKHNDDIITKAAYYGNITFSFYESEALCCHHSSVVSTNKRAYELCYNINKTYTLVAKPAYILCPTESVLNLSMDYVRKYVEAQAYQANGRALLNQITVNANETASRGGYAYTLNGLARDTVIPPILTLNDAKISQVSISNCALNILMLKPLCNIREVKLSNIVKKAPQNLTTVYMPERVETYDLTQIDDLVLELPKEVHISQNISTTALKLVARNCYNSELEQADLQCKASFLPSNIVALGNAPNLEKITIYPSTRMHLSAILHQPTEIVLGCKRNGKGDLVAVESKRKDNKMDIILAAEKPVVCNILQTHTSGWIEQLRLNVFGNLAKPFAEASTISKLFYTSNYNQQYGYYTEDVIGDALLRKPKLAKGVVSKFLISTPVVYDFYLGNTDLLGERVMITNKYNELDGTVIRYLSLLRNDNVSMTLYNKAVKENIQTNLQREDFVVSPKPFRVDIFCEIRNLKVAMAAYFGNLQQHIYCYGAVSCLALNTEEHKSATRGIVSVLRDAFLLLPMVRTSVYCYGTKMTVTILKNLLKLTPIIHLPPSHKAYVDSRGVKHKAYNSETLRDKLLSDAINLIHRDIKNQAHISEAVTIAKEYILTHYQICTAQEYIEACRFYGRKQEIPTNALL